MLLGYDVTIHVSTCMYPMSSTRGIGEGSQLIICMTHEQGTAAMLKMALIKPLFSGPVTLSSRLFSKGWKILCDKENKVSCSAHRAAAK